MAGDGCCCGGCCQNCCNNNPPATLHATVTTDCGTFTGTLTLAEFLCCDNSGQPIQCGTNVLPQLNGSCLEYDGVIQNIECPILINAEGQYACQGIKNKCLHVLVSFLDGSPQACLNGNVQCWSYDCGFPQPNPGNGFIVNGINCAAVNISQDITTINGVVVLCDHGQNLLTITA